MAESDFLSAADLLNFNRQVQGNSLSGMASQAIGGWSPNMTTWSPTEQGLGSFGKTFLSALLGNYARQDASDQLSKVVSVLPQLGASPNSVAVPEGVDADAFNVLKGKAALGDMMASVLGKQQQAAAKGKVLGELEAYGYKPPETVTEGGTGGAQGAKIEEIPGTPQFEAAQKRTKESFDNERTLNNDFTKDKTVQDFKYKEQGLKALSEAYKDISGTSDFELIRRGAQMVEPGLAVRADDQQSIVGAASALGMSVAAVKAAIEGNTKLDSKVRDGIMRIAQRAYNSTLDDYNTVRNNYVTRAADSRLNPAKVVPYGAGKAFDELYPDLARQIGGGAAVKPSMQLDNLSGVEAAKAEFARKARASGMPIEEARRAWALEEKKLLGGVSASSADILNMR
jgi:hypothetical protein